VKRESKKDGKERMKQVEEWMNEWIEDGWSLPLITDSESIIKILLVCRSTMFGAFQLVIIVAVTT
jgi:hypothetical protein